MKRKLICGHCAHLNAEHGCEMLMQPVGHGGDACTSFIGYCKTGCAQCVHLDGIIGNWGTCKIDGKPENIYGPRCDDFKNKVE